MADSNALHLDDLKAAPHLMVEISTTEKFSIPPDRLAEFHLSALQKRFRDLVGKVSMLRRFAEEQNLSDINRIEDGALLLVPHTIYKSYPLTAIESAKFDVLTRW